MALGNNAILSGFYLRSQKCDKCASVVLQAQLLHFSLCTFSFALPLSVEHIQLLETALIFGVLSLLITYCFICLLSHIIALIKDAAALARTAIIASDQCGGTLIENNLHFIAANTLPSFPFLSLLAVGNY